MITLNRMERKNKKRTIFHSKKTFPEDYRWELAFESVEELTGVSPKAIRRVSKATPLPAIRMILSHLMYRDLQMTPEYIAKQLNKDRTSVYYYVNTMDEYKDKSPYKEYYEAIKEIFYRKLNVLGYTCTCCGALEPLIKGDKYLKPIR